jgi:hypothetical protein
VTVSIVAGSTVVSTGTASSIDQSVTPTLPTGTAGNGDRVYILVDAVGTVATPTNWTSVSNSQLGTGAASSGAGLRWVAVFYRDYDGVWSMPSVTSAAVANNAIAAAAVTMRKASDEVWNAPTSTTGSDTTSGTAYSATGSSIASPTGAGVLLATGIPAIVTTASETFTQSGATFATLVNSVVSGGTTLGFRADVVAYTTTVTTGATAAPVHALTLGTARVGGTVFVFQTVTVTGALAGSLPGPTGSLAGDVIALGALAGSLPTPNGTLAGSVAATGALGSVLPALSGQLLGDLLSLGALQGVLPSLGGSLAGAPIADGAVSGALPAPVGTFSGLLLSLGEATGFLPPMAGALTGITTTAGVISGSLPTPTQELTGSVYIGGLILGVLPAMLGAFEATEGVSRKLMMELQMNRKNTKAFIAADPVVVTLQTRTPVRSAIGGWITEEGEPRAPQTFKLIMQSPAGGSLEQRTEDGTEREVDFILLGLWDAEIDIGDWWEDENDNIWEVRALVPSNGYETRAVIEAHGKHMDGG